MAHVIETIRNVEFEDAIAQLQSTHDLLVERAVAAQRNLDFRQSSWGIGIKRLEVELPQGEFLVGKSSEKFVELVNILATTERTLSALHWFSKHYLHSIVRECHASTSDDKDGNDIVLVDRQTNKVLVRCEVTDVASSSSSQNKKEKKDLESLGCIGQVPSDEVDRFIATSSEFGCALASTQRKWHLLHFRYELIYTDSSDKTCLLKISRSNLDTFISSNKTKK